MDTNYSPCEIFKFNRGVTNLSINFKVQHLTYSKNLNTPNCLIRQLNIKIATLTH